MVGLLGPLAVAVVAGMGTYAQIAVDFDDPPTSAQRVSALLAVLSASALGYLSALAGAYALRRRHQEHV